MGYCDIDDVEEQMARYLKQQGLVFSEDTTPNRDQVTSLIAKIYAEINAELAGIGVSPVPPTDTTALAALELYNALGAASMAAAIMFPGKSGPAGGDLGSELRSQYEDRLTLISQGKGVAAMLLSSGGVSSPLSNYTEGDYEEGSDGTQKRAFTKGQVW